MSAANPKCILLFSGKRKSGKDHLTEWLAEKVTDSKILRLSGPLKKCYADNHGLDFESLLSSGAYKEQHRLDMIKACFLGNFLHFLSRSPFHGSVAL